jgi:thiol-disulfide isomerase/thioredoxin
MRKLLAVLLVTLATGAVAADFTSLDRPTGRSLTAAASHTRPTVVALWTSDCVYCKKNLRTLATLAKTNRQLRIVTVAAEVPGPATRPEIDKTGVPGERYAYGDDVPEALAYALDPHWRGELPRTYLFDGKGGVQAVSGVIDAAGFRAALQLK